MNSLFIKQFMLYLFFGFLFTSFVSFAESFASRILDAFYYKTRKKILHKWKYIFQPYSLCDFCKRRIPIFFLIPILGILLSRFKCKHCKHKISKHYFYLEIVAFFYGVFVISQLTMMEVVFLSFIFVIICIICIIDYKVMFIPTHLLLLLLFFCLLEYLFVSESYLLDFLFACIWYVLFYLIYILSRHRLGFADVQFIFPLSLSLTFSYSIYLTSLASILAIVFYFIINQKIKKEELSLWMKKKIPFGSFLGITYLLLKLKPAFFRF